MSELTGKIFEYLASPRFSPVYWIAAAVTLAITLVELAYKIFSRATGDVAIFAAVGKAVAHGQTLYSGIFDSKPPGIYLVSALSQIVMGNIVLASFMTAAAIVALFALLTIVLFKTTSKVTWIYSPALGVAISSLIILYTSVRVGQLGHDAFAIIFSFLYAMVVMRERWNRLSLFLAALCIAGAVFFREPYIVTIFAVALLAGRSWKDLWSRFLLPGAVALPFFFAAITLSGVLYPYVTLYLENMLFAKGGTLSPLVIGFFALRSLQVMAEFSPFFVLALGILAASIFVAEKHRRLQVLAAFAVTVVTTTFGGGVYDTNAVPVLGMIVVLGLPAISALGRFRAITGTVLVACTLAAVIQVGFRYALNPPIMQVDVAWEEQTQFARDLDRILDDCNVQTYTFIGLSGVHFYAFTEHQPEGPLFMYDKYFIGNKLLRDEHIKDVQEAHIVVLRDHTNLNPLEQGIYDEAKSHITDMKLQPFPCSKTTAELPGYTVLYRP